MSAFTGNDTSLHVAGVSSSCCAGVLAATEHRWDDAEKQFRIVLEHEPDSASAWSNLGNVHLSKGRPQEAYRDFTEAIRLAPTVS